MFGYSLDLPKPSGRMDGNKTGSGRQAANDLGGGSVDLPSHFAAPADPEKESRNMPPTNVRWIWPLRPLREGAWESFQWDVGDVRPGQTIHVAYAQGTLLNGEWAEVKLKPGEPKPSPYMVQLQARQCYIPTDSDLALLTRHYPGDDPNRPAWQRIKADLTLAGNDRAQLVKSEVPLLLAMLAKAAPTTAAAQAVPGGASQVTVSTNEFDAFLCHASEDKKAIVEPFADAMERAGLKPWLDEGQVTWGDGLIHRIQNGLARSRFVVVFVSAAFLGKGWPEKELDAALSMEMGRRKVVLPILLGLTHAEVEGRYPMVSCKKYKEVPEYAPGKRVSKKIIAAMVDELKAFIS